MRKADTKHLSHGLYRIGWKSGGISLAAIGSTHDGTRWFAPTNWTSESNKAPLVASTYWRLVQSVELIQAA